MNISRGDRGTIWNLDIAQDDPLGNVDQLFILSLILIQQDRFAEGLAYWDRVEEIYRKYELSSDHLEWAEMVERIEVRQRPDLANNVRSAVTQQTR